MDTPLASSSKMKSSSSLVRCGAIETNRNKRPRPAKTAHLVLPKCCGRNHVNGPISHKQKRMNRTHAAVVSYDTFPSRAKKTSPRYLNELPSPMPPRPPYFNVGCLTGDAVRTKATFFSQLHTTPQSLHNIEITGAGGNTPRMGCAMECDVFSHGADPDRNAQHLQHQQH